MIGVGFWDSLRTNMINKIVPIINHVIMFIAPSMAYIIQKIPVTDNIVPNESNLNIVIFLLSKYLKDSRSITAMMGIFIRNPSRHDK